MFELDYNENSKIADIFNRAKSTTSGYEKFAKQLSLIAKEPEVGISLLYQQGRALKGLGRNREALATFQNILEQDSLQTRAYIEAAECCKSLAKHRQAITYYQQATSLNPNNKYARLQYISLLLAQKQYQTALDESNKLAQ